MKKLLLSLSIVVILVLSNAVAFAQDAEAPPTIGDVVFDEDETPPSLETPAPDNETPPSLTVPTTTPTPTPTTTTTTPTPSQEIPLTGPPMAIYGFLLAGSLGAKKLLDKLRK